MSCSVLQLLVLQTAGGLHHYGWDQTKKDQVSRQGFGYCPDVFESFGGYVSVSSITLQNEWRNCDDGHSASSGNKSMNCTNQHAHQCIAIDLVNATMVRLRVGDFPARRILHGVPTMSQHPRVKKIMKRWWKMSTCVISSWKQKKTQTLSTARLRKCWQ